MTNVHKDFHGALSYGIQYLYEHYGEAELEEFLQQVAREVYHPLIEKLKNQGLSALEEHWRRIFTLEGGEFEVSYEGEQLVLKVHKCPAIHHMKDRGYLIAEKYCEHTRIVNESICRVAGYDCSVDYDQDAGRCVQRFWKGKSRQGGEKTEHDLVH